MKNEDYWASIPSYNGLLEKKTIKSNYTNYLKKREDYKNSEHRSLSVRP